MLDRRAELETEIAAQVGSWLDFADEMYPDGFQVNTFAVIFETEFPPEEEGGFPNSQIGFTCSDTRNWVKAGLFRRAMLIADRESQDPSEDE